MKKFILAPLLLMLSACAADSLREGLPYLVGKPIENAIYYIGFPTDQQTIAGNNVYMWNYQREFTTMETVSTPYSGTAYGMGMGGGISYSGQTSTVVPRAHNYYCSIRLIADRKGVVRDFDWQGNQGGCERYSDAFGRIKEDATKAQTDTDKSGQVQWISQTIRKSPKSD